MDEYLPGAAGLIVQLDTEILIVLRDGRNLVGTLRSFDQYMNLVLDSTSERLIFEGRDDHAIHLKINLIPFHRPFQTQTSTVICL